MAKSTKEKETKISSEKIEGVKESVKKKVVEETTLSKEEEEILVKCLEEAKMPVEMLDKDLVLGERELDIRKLSEKNLDQMMFRMQILNVVYQRQLTQNLIDIERLLMVLLKKLGVEDVIGATDELLEELTAKIYSNNTKKN